MLAGFVLVKAATTRLALPALPALPAMTAFALRAGLQVEGALSAPWVTQAVAEPAMSC